MIKAIIFDYDGVIAESAGVKTEVFRELFCNYPDKVEEIVRYHRENGGISRYVKFRHVYANILKERLSQEKENELGERFSKIALQRVLDAPFVKGAREFLDEHKDRYHFFIASGTPEGELRDIVCRRGLAVYFKGIHGSPKEKSNIINDIMKRHRFKRNEVVYVGDAPTDRAAAEKARIFFVERNQNGGAEGRFLAIKDLSDLEKALAQIKKPVFRKKIKNVLDFALLKSLRAAAKAQGFQALIDKLEKTLPDISDQYSRTALKSRYLTQKVRNMHAFQIELVNKILGEFKEPFIVDIGDSSGNHLLYMQKLNPNKKTKCLSVNLDEKAVTKIKNKNLDAIQARAEDLHKLDLKPDIILSFELLEHLTDPVRFLYGLSKTSAKYLVITVPYLRQSRVGLHHIRQNLREARDAEDTHIFELSPSDWGLLLRHSGWDIVEESVYTQYPRRGFWRITEPLWRKFDFEGFYGLILKKDDYWSSRFKDW